MAAVPVARSSTRPSAAWRSSRIPRAVTARDARISADEPAKGHHPARESRTTSSPCQTIRLATLAGRSPRGGSGRRPPERSDEALDHPRSCICRVQVSPCDASRRSPINRSRCLTQRLHVRWNAVEHGTADLARVPRAVIEHCSLGTSAASEPLDAEAHQEPGSEEVPASARASEDGRGGFRTCDLSRVKRALSH
jgi:hypothetical protein